MRVTLLLLLTILLITIPAAANAKKIDRKVSIQTVHDTITQGETDWYYKRITSSTFTVSLVWNNPSNSLTLTVYSPNGWTTFTDSSDGSIDGKIVITIYDAIPGYWFFEVYGAKVEGIQPYSFTVT